MNDDLQSRWWPTRRQVLWTTVGIAAVALYVLIRIGYTLQWTGFGQAAVAQHVRPAKTLWDWMDLLIVPAMLGVGGYFVASLFTSAQTQATLEAEERRAQDEALQAYLDQMSAMLIPNKEQPSLSDKPPPDSLKTVARARTLTVLPRLAGDGKGRVVQFLHESNLIPRVVRDKQREVVQAKVVDLSGANLSDAHLSRLNLSGANLSSADLSGANLSGARLLGQANLSRADLSGANLSSANLSSADLSGANLSGANLSGQALLSHADLSRANLPGAELSRALLSRADLSGANLSSASLSSAVLDGADLPRANLSGANLSSAHLSRADLSGANLSGADLTDATITEKQLAQCASLDGATMPNGQKYED